MEVAARLEGNIAIVTLAGQLDALTAPEARQVFHEYGTGGYHAVIDLENVTFIDSSGLASLISGLKTYRAHGCEFMLASIQPNVMQVFALTMLDRAFHIAPDVSSAIASLPGAVEEQKA